MSQASKVFIGFLSFLPIILLIIFFGMFLTIFPRIFEWDSGYEPAPQEVFNVFAPIFILGIFMAVVSLGLLVFFIMHLVRNRKVEGMERIVWILIFVFVSMVGYPIYWYMRIWREE